MLETLRVPMNQGKSSQLGDMSMPSWVYVHLLAPNGTAVWRWVTWGKQSLDKLRCEGYTIIGTYYSQPY